MADRFMIDILEKTYYRQGEVVFSFGELRDRLFAELVALQDGAVPVQHALAAAALARQIQQSCEAEIERVRQLRDDTKAAPGGDDAD